MVELKPFNWANLNTHFEWNNDSELTYYDSDYPHQHESFESFVSRVKRLNSEANKSCQIFEITSAFNGELIGVVDITGIDQINNRCCVEVTIGNKEYRNKGFGKMAMLQTLKHCFSNLGMHKISCVSFDFNECWIHLVKTLGFQEEGRLRKHVKKEKNYCDKIIFGLLKEEYDDLTDKLHERFAEAV